MAGRVWVEIAGVEHYLTAHQAWKLEQHRLDPRCRWCGVETVFEIEYRKKMADNIATIDHLIHRYDREPPHPIGPWLIHGGPAVLACYKCNWSRGRVRDLEYYYGPRKGQRNDRV